MLISSQAFIQQVPGVSPTNPYSTIVPLGIVLAASAVKETQEDIVGFCFYCLFFMLKLYAEKTPV
jgi:hypothetical protein